MEKNFVLYRASRGEKAGEELYKRFKVQGTPFLLFLDGDGKEVDWIYSYSAPPAKFHEKVLKVLKGEDTFRALSSRLAAEPENALLTMQVARKYAARFDEGKAEALYKEVLALDPEGKAGPIDYNGRSLGCAELADFCLALNAGNKNQDPAPLRAFTERRPASPLVRDAYQHMAAFYMMGRSKEEAYRFFEDGLTRFPGYPPLINNYLNRIQQEKDNLDRGIELGKELGEAALYGDFSQESLADLHVLKGDFDMAEAEYGPEYVDGQLSNLAWKLQAYAQFWIMHKKNTESALRAMETALQLRPDDAYAWRSAAEFYIEAGMPEKADEVYGSSYAEKFKNDAQALALYGLFWANQKKNQESAVAAAEAAIKLEPDQYFIRSMAASVETLTGHPEKAEEIFGPGILQAMRRDSQPRQLPYYLYQYASYWAGQGKHLDSALEAIQEAIAEREMYFFYEGLARVYLAMGRPEEALAALNKGVEISGGNEAHFKEIKRKIQEALDKKKDEKK